MSRPEVAWRRARHSRTGVAHIFLEGTETPVCGTWAREWVGSGSRARVHGECWRLCPWRPRLNAVLTEDQIAREHLP